MLTKLVAQGDPAGTTLSAALSEIAQIEVFDRLDVAVAYATLQGVKELESALGMLPPVTRWVVGLDDAITQPEAIEHLMMLNNSSLRVASLAPQRRFHPKLYRLWSSAQPGECVLAIGSGNMTSNGLRRNGEAAVLLTSESVADADALHDVWRQMWELGHDATPAILNAYRAKYVEARKQRKKIEALGVAPPEPEADAAIEEDSAFDGNPATATVAWTEGATPSAGGRDLEFPRAMMPFFALGKSPVNKWLRMANGQRFLLTFTERTDNQMWRLMFSRDSINAAIGRDSLRPIAGGNRSDLAITFTSATGGADYDVRMVVIGSPGHGQLLARSRAVGGLQRTRNPGGRNFGFF